MSFKKLLEDKNITGYKLSKDTKIAQSTISDYLTQKKNFYCMQIGMAYIISEYLGISLDEFFQQCNN